MATMYFNKESSGSILPTWVQHYCVFVNIKEPMKKSKEK